MEEGIALKSTGAFRKVEDLPHIERRSRQPLAGMITVFGHYLSRTPLAEPSINLASRFCRVSSVFALTINQVIIFR